MSATKHPTRNTPSLSLLRRRVKVAGIAYGTARDAHFRGELPIYKIGRNERYARWYVDEADFDRWIESLRVTHA